MLTPEPCLIVFNHMLIEALRPCNYLVNRMFIMPEFTPNCAFKHHETWHSFAKAKTDLWIFFVSILQEIVCSATLLSAMVRRYEFSFLYSSIQENCINTTHVILQLTVISELLGGHESLSMESGQSLPSLVSPVCRHIYNSVTRQNYFPANNDNC